MADQESVVAIRKEIEAFIVKLKDGTFSNDEVHAVLATLRRLETLDIDRSMLQNTRIGVILTKLSKYDVEGIDEIKNLASNLTTRWKDSLRRQASGDNSLESSSSKRKKSDASTDQAAAEPRYRHSYHNDDIRDKAIIYLFKSLLAGKENVYDHKKAGRLAYDMEAGLFSRYLYNQNNQKDYTLKLKSIAFNLKDPKNSTFSDKIYNGDIEPRSVAIMEAAEMASEEKKMERINILQESLEACQSDWAVKNILLSKEGKKKGQFKCLKCHSMETVYYQLQTRSSDEPMTTFVTCLECNNRWKF
ncbi:Transcription factor S-II (TFIIS) central domain family protein [Babesia bovis T2Bo]|uniref:Transcription factor S-II (TFIIS)and transcription factor S-II (TFIIS) central domain containing protein n=1 Tax=Babesia bovis TaxID=5865 RepID=A7AWE5_BABBO|nr:Transcription factor S-II (TFIIS) central domain family protein [Babesia bovis T2Bo]EDO05373.1 Transcription factor S-II (TFIIS) central domain family protein [Babesia bovis T2Bo]|eukprot:XP_001608941.1 transcription factor S-II (TFIIS)and transcription factor S-II (TFIIS) central domain containing protein [Babesia bovis T2Bo]